MRNTIIAAMAALAIGLGAVPVQAQDEVNWLALPEDKAALQELDTQQTRALRDSVRHCDDVRRSDHSGTPCVFLDLDRTMRQAEDAALRSYHFALPRSMRYDEARNSGAATERVMKLREEAVE